MDFRVLRYFITVAQELNFTRAAEKLNMSQPPLSNQIKLLEEDLGVQLFIRGKRHLTLTEAGSFFYTRANQMLELADKTRRDLAYMNNNLTGKICLGIVEGRPPYLAARWITGFREEFPMVRFEIWNGSSDDVLDHLHRGLADLAIIAKPYDHEHLNAIAVDKEPWVAIIPKNHPLAQREGDSISLMDLKDEPLITPRRESRVEEIRQWFRDIAGQDPTILCEMSSYVDVVALAEQNAGIGIFPQTTYTPNEMVVSKMIVDSPKILEYCLVWQKSHPISSLVQEFINYVEDFIEEDRMHSQRFQVKTQEFELPEQ
ncbi:MAG: LysR family transcriptional regulator [Lachnospiraceae bacterium]|nr:LysR family transcriptional regulator [Lachnospiraceae bacterium]